MFERFSSPANGAISFGRLRRTFAGGGISKNKRRGLCVDCARGFLLFSARGKTSTDAFRVGYIGGTRVLARVALLAVADAGAGIFPFWAGLRCARSSPFISESGPGCSPEKSAKEAGTKKSLVAGRCGNLGSRWK